MADRPITPGATVGILGGGQLGRMLALAAAELGLSCHVYCPDPKSPAFAVAAARTVAPYDDEASLAAFAAAVDVVTFEFENVPAATVELLAASAPVRPGALSLAVSQDRLAEKQLMGELGIAVPTYVAVDTLADIYSALAKTGRPAILKTRRLGYDGKGQATIRPGDDPVAAWRMIGEAPSLLEAFVTFEREVSVILARSPDGATATWDVTENHHKTGILDTSTVPAAISPELAADALAMAGRIATALDHVGVLAVEMFVVDGALMVNEIAPRVHNSGHWTRDAAFCSQFEQHIRAICGWPLGDTRRLFDAEMANLIGEAGNVDPASLAASDVLTLYGKHEARPGRKMGHITRRLAPRKA